MTAVLKYQEQDTMFHGTLSDDRYVGTKSRGANLGGPRGHALRSRSLNIAQDIIERNELKYYTSPERNRAKKSSKMPHANRYFGKKTIKDVGQRGRSKSHSSQGKGG
ncbi:hypothetical protein WA026_012025 [Henosepilachna vigintioctopunctata]|uniref:Uncharacterized protein n=1 Tax=Henosepilachna vigintioctopunctata TaxID=420089 RepID=A0AAW1V4Q6_9CUCU